MLESAEMIKRMREAMAFEPTATQMHAMKALAMMMNSVKPRPTLIINGFAGTGKTTLMKAFCDMLSETGQNMVLMAPTGRSAKVLAAYTGRKAGTIHRTIYRQESAVDANNFERTYNKWRETVFIVDEASMIGDTQNAYNETVQWGEGRLLEDLMEFVFSQEGARLVLVGDPDQLPPIGLERAPALDPEYVKRFGVTLGRVWLTDVVRQGEESLILRNAMRLREIIDGEEEEVGRPQMESDEKRDLEMVGGEELLEKLEDAYRLYGPNETIIVTRSNKRATQYNLAIRSQSLYYDELLTAGDKLIVTKNNYLWGEKAGCGFIANGDIVEVVKIYRYEEMYGLRFADVSIRLVEKNDIDIDCKIVLDFLTADVKEYNELSGSVIMQSTQEIQAKLEGSVAEDYAEYTNKRNKAEDMRKDVWLNALQVRYAYALTCHKAQGGQWSAVFIDTGYVDEEQPNGGLCKWLYTAITRAKEKVYLINYAERE